MVNFWVFRRWKSCSAGVSLYRTHCLKEGEKDPGDLILAVINDFRVLRPERLLIFFCVGLLNLKFKRQERVSRQSWKKLLSFDVAIFYSACTDSHELSKTA